MRVGCFSFAEFQRKLITNDLFDELERNYTKVVGRSVGFQEANSWRSSLPRLEAVLRLAEVPEDVWISVEERVPYFAQRIDATIFGHDAAGLPHIVIIELKGWTEAKALPSGNVETFFRGAPSTEPHPSVQVSGYHDHLLDFCRALQGERPILLSSCAYCHNYKVDTAGRGLFDPQFNDLRIKSPLFGERDAIQMADFLRDRLSGGRGEAVLRAFDNAGVGPSKQLVEHTGEMIRRQNVFRLLDEQIAANKEILSAVRRAAKRTRKQVIVVKGGPGTGKSVIALNAFGEVLRKGLTVYFATGSSAFTSSIRKLLGKRLEGLVRFTDYFWDYEANSIDVLIVDEGHRIRARSLPRVPRERRPTIGQVEELIKAAKVLIIFTDENQIISPREVGEPAFIRSEAHRLGAKYTQFQLVSQFRCNGSDAYLTWLDDMLGITPEDQGLKLLTPTSFNFKVISSPQELLQEVRHLNDQEPNSARLIAGWCWPWSNPNSDGSLVEDVVIGDFHFPWEAKNRSKPAPGIPEARWWAIMPAGADQAGTVYSVQGFEAKHIGVIIGPDLVVRNDVWTAQPQNNYSNELRRKRPEEALPYIKRIYRTLLSRGMHSCSVFCADEETEQYLKSRLLVDS